MGRPSKYTPELVAEICERIANGETLRAICRDEHMPHWTVVYDWIKADESVALRIAQARDLGFDAIAEEALEIADTPVEGARTKRTTEGYEVLTEDMLGHRKLQVDTRLKLLAKWSPKKYGDKTSMELTGKDGGPVDITDTEREKKLAALMAQAQARKDVSDLV